MTIPDDVRYRGPRVAYRACVTAFSSTADTA